MVLSRNKPIVCPVLIGREADLTALHVLIDQAKRGEGQVALISGEAGIGKSRLVAEGKTYAITQGFRLLQGNCFPGDISCPYAPLLDLLRSQFGSQSGTEIATELRPFAREFFQLVPDLVPLPPDSIPKSSLTPIELEQEKRRLFEALTRWFTGLATKQPVLLIVEDVHWSDDSSLEFLQYLARRCASYPLLLLVTYRNDEVRSNLSNWLTQLDRERLAQDFPLARLTRSDLDVMLRTILVLPRSMQLELLDPMYTLTDGNPFFIEEILKSLIVSGEIFYANGTWNRRPLSELHVPRSLQDTVQQRTEQLSEPAREVLLLAAVAGRRFDFALLQQLTQHDEQELLRLIKDLMNAQLVVEESEERFAFRHALTQQAMYAQLLVRERKMMHRIIAETIEQLHASTLGAHLADLASHFSEAGLWEKALEYAQRAGERAQRLYDSRAAIEQFTLAMDAARSLGIALSVMLYRARGQAYETLGTFEQARSDYEHALEIAQTTHDEVAEWQSMLDIGFLWAGRDYVQAGEWFSRSLDRAQALADPKLHARSLNRVGNWLVNTGRAEEGLHAHQEALAMFEALHDTQGIAETFDLLGMANGIYGDTVNAVEQYERAIKLLRSLSDQQNLISSLTSLVTYASPFLVETTYSVCAGLEPCSRDITEALSLARQADSLTAQAYVEMVASGAFASFGEFGSGLAHGQASLQIASDIKHTQWIAGAYFSLGHVYILLLEANLAMQALETGLALAIEIGSYWWAGAITSYLARACLLQGALPRAEAVLKAVMPREQQPANSPERRLSWAWGELALATGEPEMALSIADQLLASVPGTIRAQPIPWLLKLKGEALGGLSRQEDAIQALEEARQGAQARHEQPLLWQIHRALGRQHQHLKQEDLAQRNFTSARQGIESLAGTIDDVYLREQFLHTALSTLPKEKPVSVDRVAKNAFGGLTPREHEVATLIAQGKYNREIAEALVVSERTVETHISNIFLKLGFSSRTQIATWVVEKRV